MIGEDGGGTEDSWNSLEINRLTGLGNTHCPFLGYISSKQFLEEADTLGWSCLYHAWRILPMYLLVTHTGGWGEVPRCSCL